MNILYMSTAGALWQGQAGGKLAVLGSVAMFDDKWLDVEDNAQVMDWLFRWLKPVLSCAPKGPSQNCLFAAPHPQGLILS